MVIEWATAALRREATLPLPAKAGMDFEQSTLF